MSSRRLLLVSGAPGSGASTIADALARAEQVRGGTARRIDGSVQPSSSPFAELLGPWDPLLGEAIAGLPAARTAQALLAAVRAVDDGPDDTVVWDAGPIDALLADLAALDMLTVAGARVSGSLVALAASLAGERLTVARRMLQDLERALELLRAGTTTMVLVDEPEPGLRSRIRAARARAALLGLPIDLLVVNRVPRRRDDWPADWAKGRRRRAAAAADLGIASCAIRWILGGAGGADDGDHATVVRRIAKRLPMPPVRTSGGGDVVDAAGLTLEGRGDGYALRIPMAHAEPEAVRVGRMGDVLVLEVSGLRRVIALPAVLARCTVDGGGIVGDDLVLRFSPDPAQWRSAS